MKVTVVDSRTIEDALADADAHRDSPDGVRRLLAAHIDLLVAELRDVTQAHADALEARVDLTAAIRAALEASN